VTFIIAGPFMRWGIPQANSVTSVTLRTSPIASFHTFPFSAATSRVNSSRCVSMRDFIRKSIWTLMFGGVFAQAGKAALAAEIASCISADVH
jgi:hypothetical protein